MFLTLLTETTDEVCIVANKGIPTFYLNGSIHKCAGFNGKVLARTLYPQTSCSRSSGHSGLLKLRLQERNSWKITSAGEATLPSDIAVLLVCLYINKVHVMAYKSHSPHTLYATKLPA